MTRRHFNNLLITGGAGFIGSNFLRYVLNQTNYSGRVINLDNLTYAGNLTSLVDLTQVHGGRRYFFVKGDICDSELVAGVFKDYEVDAVAHFAAESHVDRSIQSPEAFIRTNVMGTFKLLDVARRSWLGRKDVLFHHVSTDEVYGSLGPDGYFTEETPYDPRSPYSASKASSDHLVRAYHHTYGLPITLTNCSNNYGPYQFPEKLLPLMILNMIEGKPLPVYGDGKNIRDWLYVEDHNAAVWAVMTGASTGESYNLGGENEWQNIQLIHTLCEVVAEALGRQPKDFINLIHFVPDRLGHDLRYAVDCSKIKKDLGWAPAVNFREGLLKTVRWYLENQAWTDGIRSGEYSKWIEANYLFRG